jgi:hypothetical protein
MALPGEAPNVFTEGIAWLLSATVQVLGFVRSHVRALEVAREDLKACEDLFEILPTIDHVSQQVV